MDQSQTRGATSAAFPDTLQPPLYLNPNTNPPLSLARAQQSSLSLQQTRHNMEKLAGVTGNEVETEKQKGMKGQNEFNKNAASQKDYLPKPPPRPRY